MEIEIVLEIDRRRSVRDQRLLGVGRDRERVHELKGCPGFSAYGLSERERRVVDRVVQGASTKEIARALSISEYTVQEHLTHAFDKVGVRGRRALVQRLFLDNLYPALALSSEVERSGLMNGPSR